jgi:hypothetical protein
MTSADQVLRLSFYTSYRQFYLVDPGAQYDTSDPNFWSEEAFNRGMAIADGALGIGTVSYGHIRAFFAVSGQEPTLPLSPWQRVVEASVRLARGRYALLDCPDSTVIHEGACAAGEYRLRVYGAFLDHLVEDTAGDDYFDFYWLVLWPATFSEPRILKHYNEAQKSSS